ncbi:MAG TPA: hypothetical protein VF899_11375, partial [Pyrinomonadaceae bacterium]
MSNGAPTFEMGIAPSGSMYTTVGEFFDALEQLIAFTSHVGDMLAFVLGGDLAHLNQLVGFRIKCWGVNER